ncbi:MAG: esterase-like activity of phytase family protein [Sphingobacteriales bacterium]|nr:esterase-like activity of phytase family protein [Sphingobacteriales bacterium]
MKHILLLLLYCGIIKNTCCAQKTVHISTVKLIGSYLIPHDLKYSNTTVGGLSGIDYDIQNKQYYIISDDKSNKNPARFYTAKININAKGIDSIYFTGVANILQHDDIIYPSDKGKAPDPEAIRYNPVTGKLTWCSEGERIVHAKDLILLNPSIITMSIDGKYADSFPLPENLFMHATEKGPRQNGVFEGLTFADNYHTLYASIEEPLYEDSPQADTTDNESYIRIIQFDVKSKKNTAQFAYKLDPVAHSPIPKNRYSMNGVSDILSTGNNQLLILERSYSTGRQGCTVKLFIADIAGASNISATPLATNSHFTPASKKLLLNSDDLSIYIDNIEGITFGPILPNGHKTLICIADNNFNSSQQSQVLLLEITE